MIGSMELDLLEAAPTEDQEWSEIARGSLRPGNGKQDEHNDAVLSQ
jgi:hypothetical protein